MDTLVPGNPTPPLRFFLLLPFPTTNDGSDSPCITTIQNNPPLPPQSGMGWLACSGNKVDALTHKGAVTGGCFDYYPAPLPPLPRFRLVLPDITSCAFAC